jgi:uncharacterized protein with ParB-like and HNH nuclease domain/predicted transport protein
MKATEANLLSLLQKSPQFVIPIYQRTYSWTETQCQQLWDDILRAGARDDVTVHFIGSIVYVEQGLSAVSHQSPLLVIDGQQRLTTVSLLLEALARAIGEDDEPLDGFSAPKLREYYLTNRLEKGDRYFKLLLSQTDNDSLKAIIKNGEPPKEPSIRVTENFKFFSNLLSQQNNDLVIVCRGLAKLVVIDIALSREQDNPQLIFESMNSTGKELSQADLIRNYILMGLDPALQTRLYEEYWRPMELDFGQDAYGTQFDSFMRHYLTFRTGEIPRESDVYKVFKDHSRNKQVHESGIEALVKDIRTFARYFCAMKLGREKNPILASVFLDFRELKVDVAYPFLLELYDDYSSSRLSLSDFASAVQLVESYVFRRAICSIPTSSLNKTFSSIGKALRKDRYLESLKAHFHSLPSYRRFPRDDEFRSELPTRDLYNFPRRSYWLRRLENYGRKERVPVDEYTIEHILPQNPVLSQSWRKELGADWQRVQSQWLHTLGNLTLTGYNAEYSDRAFTEKRDMKGGFKESPLRLNAGLGQLVTWNEVEIQHRARRLVDLALEVWSYPKVDEATLKAYYVPQKALSVLGYSIEDHPYLLAPGLRELFEAFRKEVLALDPCVSEEFLKLYVAYKAETNFVDVVPQAKRLRLALNMPFAEIYDPKGICKDVTNVGRWGNGDVEIGLKSLEDLPYVMGLVRQSYERQMGDVVQR